MLKPCYYYLLQARYRDWNFGWQNKKHPVQALFTMPWNSTTCADIYSIRISW